MWRIRHIECENFISFQSASVDIPQNVCTLIYGINLDNDKQKNNGTGKSSLVEAMAFGLTGEPLRGVDKVEEIINDHADTAHVVLTLENDFDDTKFVIDRTVSRKSPQIIECHKYDVNGNEIEKENTSQATVLDYNRYILDEIGVTKEDIYSNFILSNSKYKSFFDASDKAKKAMINRFSGADAVDRAIEALQADKEPVAQRLAKAKEEKIAIDSKIEVVEQQIAEADSKKEEYAKEKEERIKRLQDQIADKREEKRVNKVQIAKANKRLDSIDEVGALIEDMQNKGYDLKGAYTKVNDLLKQYNLSATKDYLEISKEAELAILSIKEQKKTKEDYISKEAEVLKDAQRSNEATKAKYDAFASECNKKDEQDNKELKVIATDIENVEKELSQQFTKIQNLKDTSDRLDNLIRESHNLLHGAITCPKCKHEFFINEDVSVEDVRANLKVNERKLEANNNELEKSNKYYDKLNADMNTLKQDKTDIDKEMLSRADRIQELKLALNGTISYVSDAKIKIDSANGEINLLVNRMEAESRRINGMLNTMLQEALDIIDNAIDKGERYVKTIQEKDVAIDASIEAYEKSIETVRNGSQDNFIKSLGKSIKEYKKMQETVIKRLSEVQAEFDKYVVQENYFIEFRSYLANKKVEAIAGVTNYFLELIGSDLRVEMLGFKRLKNGNIRDKITVNLLRNGVLAGSYSKHSAGERSRVNLASILGLQRLTNNSADKGKGLDLLVADEILDSEDTTGIEATCEALNRLKVTSLIVTQNPITSNEGKTIRVTKENGYSTITVE